LTTTTAALKLFSEKLMRFLDLVVNSQQQAIRVRRKKKFKKTQNDFKKNNLIQFKYLHFLSGNKENA